MNEREFWRLIAEIEVEKLDRGDERGAVLPLYRALLNKPAGELFAYEETLSRFLFALDGPDFAEAAGESGESGDGFLYLRCYIVAKGRKYYEAVLSGAVPMPDSIEQWCEALLYQHRNAWAASRGCEIGDWPFSASVSYETGSNSALWRPSR